jgi:hypothetical protein
MIVSIDTSKIDHIDNVVVTLSAVEENTTNTFASVDVIIGNYRDQEDKKKWSCCTKKNKYHQTATKTPIAARGRLKFGHDEETRKLKRQTVDNNQSNDLEKLMARWRTGYMAFKIKATSNLPTQLTNNNAIIDSSALNNTDIVLTLKTLMRTQQQSSKDELERINIESDKKRYEKDRKTLIVIIGIVVLVSRRSPSFIGSAVPFFDHLHWYLRFFFHLFFLPRCHCCSSWLLEQFFTHW